MMNKSAVGILSVVVFFCVTAAFAGGTVGYPGWNLIGPTSFNVDEGAVDASRSFLLWSDAGDVSFMAGEAKLIAAQAGDGTGHFVVSNVTVKGSAGAYAVNGGAFAFAGSPRVDLANGLAGSLSLDGTTVRSDGELVVSSNATAAVAVGGGSKLSAAGRVTFAGGTSVLDDMSVKGVGLSVLAGSTTLKGGACADFTAMPEEDLISGELTVKDAVFRTQGGDRAQYGDQSLRVSGSTADAAKLVMDDPQALLLTPSKFVAGGAANTYGTVSVLQGIASGYGFYNDKATMTVNLGQVEAADPVFIGWESLRTDLKDTTFNLDNAWWTLNTFRTQWGSPSGTVNWNFKGGFFQIAGGNASAIKDLTAGAASGTQNHSFQGGVVSFLSDYAANSKLNGGKVSANLVGDGGLVRTYDGVQFYHKNNVIPSVFLGGFDTAVLGPKGLVVSASEEATITQDFTESVSGRGRLTLAGDAVKKLGGSDSKESFLDLVGGETVILSGSGSAHASAALTVTNGAAICLTEANAATFASVALGGATPGILRAKAGAKLTASGAVTVGQAAVALDYALAAGTTHDLMFSGTAASSEAKAAWAAVTLTAGRAAGVAPTFGTRDENGGTTFFVTGTADETVLSGNYDYTSGGIAFSATDATFAKFVVSGTAVASGAVAVPGTAVFDVASGASANLGSGLSAARLVKKGKGTLRIGGASGLGGGFTLHDGLLEFETSASTGLGNMQMVEATGGTLAFKGNGKSFENFQLVLNSTNGTLVSATKGYTGAVTIRTDTDVKMAFPRVSGISSTSAAYGNFIKRGAGKLTFRNASSFQTLFAGTQNNCTYGLTGPEFDKNHSTVFDDEGGVSGVWGNVNVAEGSMEWVGGSYGANYDSLFVGLPTLQCSANPELVLNNVNMDGNNCMRCYAVGCDMTDSNSSATEATLTLKNNSVLGVPTMGSFILGDQSTKKSLNIRLNLQDSIANVKTIKMGEYNAYGATVTVSCVRSTLTADTVTGNTYHKMDFDASTFRAYTDSSLVKIEAPYTRPVACYSFRNGSVFHSVLSGDHKTGATDANRDTVVFDDATWITGFEGANDTFTIAPCRANSLKVELKRGGVTLPVYAGSTRTLGQRLDGVGGLRKTGDGTLVFDVRKYRNGNNDAAALATYPDDSLTLAYTGVTEVVEGTVRIASAAAVREGASFAVHAGATLDLGGCACALGTVGGAGTVRNGSLDGATFDIAMAEGGVPGTLTFGDGLSIANPNFRMAVGDDGSVPGKLNLGTTRFTGAPRVTFHLGRDATSRFVTLKPLTELEVGSYEGAAPDVSQWVAYDGYAKSYKGCFSCRDGKIYMTVRERGLMLILR